MHWTGFLKNTSVDFIIHVSEFSLITGDIFLLKLNEKCLNEKNIPSSLGLQAVFGSF